MLPPPKVRKRPGSSAPNCASRSASTRICCARAAAGDRPERQPRPAAPRRPSRARPIGRNRPAGPDAARLDRRHLALVIQAAERQHDRQEEADGHDHRQVARRGQADQREHDLAREIVGRGLRQHARQLVGQQDHQQHAASPRAGDGDFAKDVPVQRAQLIAVDYGTFSEESVHWNFSVEEVSCEFSPPANSAPSAPSSAYTTRATLSAAAEELDKRIGGRIARLVKRGDLRGKTGDLVLLADLTGAPAERVVVVGLGGTQRIQAQAIPQGARERAGRSGAHRRERCGELSGAGRRRRRRHVCAGAHRGRSRGELAVPHRPTTRREQAPEALAGEVRHRRRRPRRARQCRARHRARPGIVAGMSLMRDLANQPANVCTPGYLAKAARTLAPRASQDPRARAERGGMPARCRWARSCPSPPAPRSRARLIVLEYRGGTRGEAPIGAGRQGRDLRHRRHLAQAAAGDGRDEVRHVRRRQRARHVQGGRELDLPINLVGVVPACENMPGGRATKPGDIVKSMSGQTIEVLNTDAEGRLDPLRRDHLRAALQARRRHRHRDAHRRLRRGARQSSVRLVQQRRRAGRTRSKQPACRADDRAWHMPIGEEYARAARRATSRTSPTSRAAKAARSPPPASWRSSPTG